MNNTYNLLRTHYSELDLSDLPDRRGGVRERDRHDGRFYLIFLLLYSSETPCAIVQISKHADVYDV